MLANFLHTIDFLGIVAFSFAATILAHRKGMDIAGAILISAVASIGGGTTRDLLLGRVPVFWINDYRYLIVIIASALLAQFFIASLERINKILRLVDALGLAAFSIIGIEIALQQQTSPFIAVLMGTVTATFGGIMRDMICNEIPLVLRREIYITASLIGGALYMSLMPLLTREIAALVAMLVIFSIRMIAVYKNLALPNWWRNW